MPFARFFMVNTASTCDGELRVWYEYILGFNPTNSVTDCTLASSFTFLTTLLFVGSLKGLLVGLLARSSSYFMAHMSW